MALHFRQTEWDFDKDGLSLRSFAAGEREACQYPTSHPILGSGRDSRIHLLPYGRYGLCLMAIGCQAVSAIRPGRAADPRIRCLRFRSATNERHRGLRLVAATFQSSECAAEPSVVLYRW